MERFRSLRPLFCNPRLSEESRVAFDWADEAISLTTENTLSKLYELFAPSESFLVPVRVRLEREGRYPYRDFKNTAAGVASRRISGTFHLRQTVSPCLRVRQLGALQEKDLTRFLIPRDSHCREATIGLSLLRIR